jgi:cytochrome P450
MLSALLSRTSCAGIDTTGHSLAWALYLLSQHPDVEAKVAAELAEHSLLATPTNPCPRPVAWDDLVKLTYLNAVIKVRVQDPLLGTTMAMQRQVLD